MRATRKVVATGVFALALAACGGREDAAEGEVQLEDDPIAEAVQVVEGPTRGGDGSQIGLLPLPPEQVDAANLAGELACGFAVDGELLMLARADVQPEGDVWAVVNHAGYVEIMGNGRAGGFADLEDGITLTGKGLTLRLEPGTPEATGDESTRRAARLVVQRADGAERDYEGEWTCGP